MKTILWDFDGVIVDSMKVRDWGFRVIFTDYETEHVQSLLKYHRQNGGLSRYVKIRYFFENILNQTISNERVEYFAEQFSLLMKERLTDKNNLIDETLNFIRRKYEDYNFHIVSGSDQNELQYLCKELEIEHYFISINGSPTPKNKLVADVLKKWDYAQEETCLIGDSVNDYDAAVINSIRFFGYNNTELKDLCKEYIESFDTFLNP